MMARQRKALILAVMLLLCNLIIGCGKAKEPSRSEGVYLTVHDDLNREVVLAKKPERIITLSPSFLEMLGAVKADLVGRPTSRNDVPAFAQALEEVGAVYHINIEKVVGLKPDLVIAYQGMHDKLIPVLEANHIPVIVLKMKTYQEVKDKVNLFGQITGEIQESKALIAAMDNEIQSILAKIPQTGKKVVILHGTAKNVTVELEGSIAGSTAKKLGFDNVIAGSKAQENASDAVPYSLEILVEKDPEVIFVVTMGDLAEIKKRMLVDVEANPAWNSLSAVKNKQVFFLPQELFLLNPGIRYPLAFQTMAALVYPEVFNHEK